MTKNHVTRVQGLRTSGAAGPHRNERPRARVESDAITEQLDDLPPARGSGPISCCGNHRARCKFGEPHRWSTWYEDARLIRTSDTYRCDRCGSVCTGDEED